MIVTRTAALLLVASAVPAAAQTAAEAPPAPKPEKKICRTVDTTGSIMMGTRVCHTKAEWASIDGRNGDNAGSFRDLRGANAGQQGGGGMN